MGRLAVPGSLREDALCILYLYKTLRNTRGDKRVLLIIINYYFTILVAQSRCIVGATWAGGSSLLSTPNMFKYRPTLPH